MPMNYVVDTCIINKLVDGEIELESLPAIGELVATHIQVDELNNTKNPKRRARLFLAFAVNITNIVPTETIILGTSRLAQSKLSDGVLYEKLKSELDNLNDRKSNNINDALIAEVAIKNGYKLLTADYHLNEVATSNGCDVQYWET